MSTSTTYSKISRIEFEFKRDATDPLFSFLQLHLYTPLSPQRHTLYIFPSDPKEALDHLHNIFLSTTVLISPEPPPTVDLDIPSSAEERVARADEYDAAREAREARANRD